MADVFPKGTKHEFVAVLPSSAESTFRNGASDLVTLTSSFYVGGIWSGHYIAAGRRSGVKALAKSAAWYGGSVMRIACAPRSKLVLVGTEDVGYFSILFALMVNETIDFASLPDVQGSALVSVLSPLFSKTDLLRTSCSPTNSTPQLTSYYPDCYGDEELQRATPGDVDSRRIATAFRVVTIL